MRHPGLRQTWVLFDTSAYYALADADDTNHASTQRILSRLVAERYRPFTANFLVAETHTLLLSRFGRRSAVQFLQATDGHATTVIRVSPRDERRARDIIDRSADQIFSYTDATSFAVMERLRIGWAFSFDRDFARFALPVLAD